MSNPIKTRSGLEKPASRLTLEDLFGTGPLPTPDEIKKVAENEKARKAIKAKRKGKPGRDSKEYSARLEAIRAAGDAIGKSPEWARAWHPTARVFILEVRRCACGMVHECPGADGWLVEYTNKNDGATQTYDPVGPIDYRLPIKKIEHETSVAICQHCYNPQTGEAQ